MSGLLALQPPQLRLVVQQSPHGVDSFPMQTTDAGGELLRLLGEPVDQLLQVAALFHDHVVSAGRWERTTNAEVNLNQQDQECLNQCSEWDPSQLRLVVQQSAHVDADGRVGFFPMQTTDATSQLLRLLSEPVDQVLQVAALFHVSCLLAAFLQGGRERETEPTQTNEK